MHPKDFHERIDKKRLVARLAEVESRTTGKIYVYVTHRRIDDALAAARKRFDKLGLGRIHHHRNAVLIYIAPHTHKFAILGDAAIHERCGDALWNRLAEQFTTDLEDGDIMAALLNLISELEKVMVEHFQQTNGNGTTS